MTVETKRGTQMGSICGGGTPTRMRSNAVGGETRTLCLAWEVAIMMPLQPLVFILRKFVIFPRLRVD